MLLHQLLIAVFTIAYAWHSQIAINKMRNHGASRWESKDFHTGSVIMRAAPIVIILLIDFNVWSLLTLPLLQWMLFDLSINKFMEWPLFYLGTTAKIDRKLFKWWGKDAGRYKLYICASLIFILNLLNILL